MDEFIFILELIGTVAFASSGAMIAIEKKDGYFRGEMCSGRQLR